MVNKVYAMSSVVLSCGPHNPPAELDVSDDLEYRHRQDSEGLHSPDPPCGTVCHLLCALDSNLSLISSGSI